MNPTENMNSAAKIAPALRMIYAPDGRAAVSFSDTAENISLHTDESSWEKDLTAYCSKAAADKAIVEIKGIGCFTVERETGTKSLSGKIAVVSPEVKAIKAKLRISSDPFER